jgi:hypothetical protein
MPKQPKQPKQSKPTAKKTAPKTELATVDPTTLNAVAGGRCGNCDNQAAQIAGAFGGYPMGNGMYYIPAGGGGGYPPGFGGSPYGYPGFGGGPGFSTDNTNTLVTYNGQPIPVNYR